MGSPSRPVVMVGQPSAAGLARVRYVGDEEGQELVNMSLRMAAGFNSDRRPGGPRLAALELFV